MKLWSPIRLTNRTKLSGFVVWKFAIGILIIAQFNQLTEKPQIALEQLEHDENCRRKAFIKESIIMDKKQTRKKRAALVQSAERWI